MVHGCSPDPAAGWRSAPELRGERGNPVFVGENSSFQDVDMLPGLVNVYLHNYGTSPFYSWENSL